MMKKILFQLTIMLIFTGCITSPTNKPTLKDYKIGEKWVWHWQRTVDGAIRAQGEDLKEVVNYNGELGFWNGTDTVRISTVLDQKQSNTPFLDWPLTVGKKWKYESEWENNEGTKGKTSQDAEVVSFEELNVTAGKFMAYKIEYKGLVTNSRGYKGEMSDTWWYAPALKTYIKHVNDDGYGFYTNELTYYSKTRDSLIAILDHIWRTEQEPISLRNSLGKVYGYESVEFQKQNEAYHKNHIINEMKILEILDTRGWPSNNIIGQQGNLTICNVLQHSDLETREKYLPIMRKAVEEKKLAPGLLARAEDRLATDRDDLQIYGGQMKYYPETKSFNVWPVYDPVNVDKRRAKIGLAPIAESLKASFDFEWNLEEQIKRSKEFEKEQLKNKKQEDGITNK